MARVRETPFGSWTSPITAAQVGGKTNPVDEIVVDGPDVYWLEQRAADGGRSALMRSRAGDPAPAVEVLPPRFDVVTRVYEYGSGAFNVHRGRIVFSHRGDGRLWLLEPGAEEPRPLTPEGPLRYADPVFDPLRDRVLCLREDHRAGGEAVTTIVAIPLAASDTLRDPRVLLEGRDFYFSPRLSADGARLAWIEWSHPRMPWDGTELFVATLDTGGAPRDPVLVSGGETESVCSPAWSPDGLLHFVSDRGGWWNLHRRNADGTVECLYAREAEFAGAPWESVRTVWGFATPTAIACGVNVKGQWRLAMLDTETKRLSELPFPYTQIAELRTSLDSGRAWIRTGSPRESWSIVEVELATSRCRVLARTAEARLPAGLVSVPKRIEFSTGAPAGKPTKEIAHAFFYPPANPDHRGPAGERPPLIVLIHGGPTAAAADVLALHVQFFTSRGFAVVDVNYRGSTGFGRAYREKLRGAWGIADVEDCVSAAASLADAGEVDAARLAIRGGSAGGYTTLCALTFHDAFKTGASHYGIGDLETLATDTHKFESRYLDGLIGPYPARKDLYVARSPIHHTDRMRRPVIFFQGLEDKVVPPSQTEAMVNALRAKGVPVACLTFAGEGHGFRRGENKTRALEAELWFYGRVFGFTPADVIEPVTIENESALRRPL